MLALSGVGAAGAMLLWGWVADRWNREWAYTAGSLALMAAIGVLYVVRPGADGLLGVYAALFALGGWTYDVSGSYDLAFVVSLLSAVVTVGCIWLAAPRHGTVPHDAREDERGARDSALAKRAA